MSKDLLVLADEYAAATATFARALALKDEADSMSPIAREAGDKRAVLAEALAAPIPQPPAPSDTAITYMTGYSDGREWAGATAAAPAKIDWRNEMILTDEGIEALTVRNVDARVIEAAMIAKLCAEVERLKEVVNLQVENYAELKEQNEAQHGYFNSVMQERDALQAEVKHLNLHLKATQSGRDAALARLAEIEADASTQPKMVTPYITQEHFDKTFPVNVPPSQALSLDLLQRQAFIKGWDHRGMAHELKGSVETDDRMRVLMGVFYPMVDAAPSDTAIAYMTGYSDGKEWAQTSQAVVVVEPVYQYQLANGNWIDQTKESYDYNVKHGQATVRMLYATPQAAPLYAKEQQ